MSKTYFKIDCIWGLLLTCFLGFQGQGMLDLAFEKFRKCPVDDAMQDLLWNLGLDFDRKKQFGKAAAVYKHIEKYAPAFKDVADRRKRMRTAGETSGIRISEEKGRPWRANDPCRCRGGSTNLGSV